MTKAFLMFLGFDLFSMAWIFTVLWGIERLWPRGEQAERADILWALRYWLVYALAGAALVTGTAWLRGRLGFDPPLSLSLGEDQWWAYIIGPLAFVVIYDFFNYWMHRAQHKWFWRQHSVHHAIENLSGINSYFHWTEHLFRLVFITVPMTWLMGIEGGGASVVATMITTIQGDYLHSASKLHFGPLGWFFADNRWHRIHHSIEPQHFDKNFGTGVTIWDHLFGTAYVPAKDEWPDTGVHDRPEFKTWREFLWLHDPVKTDDRPVDEGVGSGEYVYLRNGRG